MKVSIRKYQDREFYVIENLYGMFCDEIHKQHPAHVTRREVHDRFRSYVTSMQRYMNKLYVIEVNDNIVGYLFAIINTNNLFYRDPTVGEIAQLYIRPEYRYQKVGTKALRKITKWFKNHDVTHVQVSSYISNTLAIDAYKRFGFEENKVIMTMNL